VLEGLLLGNIEANHGTSSVTVVGSRDCPSGMS
jgi:hypothetical protein